jgi:hypothetical protein
LSAFDRLVGTIPFNGQILNEIAKYWFDATSDIISNHLLKVPDPTSCASASALQCRLNLSLAPTSRGVTKTSLWFNYEAGARNIVGNLMPDGLRKNELFRKNKDQRALDKEPLREWMVERGFRGDGEALVMTDEVRIATATRFILVAEELTQRSFKAPELTAAQRVANVLRDLPPASAAESVWRELSPTTSSAAWTCPPSPP